MVNNYVQSHSKKELFKKIKEDFLITKKKIYLNNGSIGPLPISTIKTLTDFFLRYSEQGPDSEEFNEYLDKLKIETRQRVADLINCNKDEVIFTQSTTEGINFITNGLKWKKNDILLIRTKVQEHYSNYLPWIKLASVKKLMVIPFASYKYNKKGEILSLYKECKRLFLKYKPKMIVTSHVMYNDGSITPVEKIGHLIKEENNTNTYFSIDGAQSVGAIGTDVKKIKCDFLSFPSFKWICGPMGLGVLYVNKKIMDDLHPIFIGSGSADIVDVNLNKGNEKKSSKRKYKIRYHDYPEKYHATFRNYPGLAGLESSLRYILRIGIQNIERRNRKLASILRDDLLRINEILIHEASDPIYRSSMVCFSFKKNNIENTTKLVSSLQKEGIILAQREIGGLKIVRASPHFYNTEEEMTITSNAIKFFIRRI